MLPPAASPFSTIVSRPEDPNHQAGLRTYAESSVGVFRFPSTEMAKSVLPRDFQDFSTTAIGNDGGMVFTGLVTSVLIACLSLAQRRHHRSPGLP